MKNLKTWLRSIFSESQPEKQGLLSPFKKGKMVTLSMVSGFGLLEISNEITGILVESLFYDHKGIVLIFHPNPEPSIVYGTFTSPIVGAHEEKDGIITIKTTGGAVYTLKISKRYIFHFNQKIQMS